MKSTSRCIKKLKRIIHLEVPTREKLPLHSVVKLVFLLSSWKKNVVQHQTAKTHSLLNHKRKSWKKLNEKKNNPKANVAQWVQRAEFEQVAWRKKESGRIKRLVGKYNKEIIMHLRVEATWGRRREMKCRHFSRVVCLNISHFFVHWPFQQRQPLFSSLTFIVLSIEENCSIKHLFPLHFFADPWQDLADGGGKAGFQRLTDYKKTHKHLKVLLAIGGWNEGSGNYSELAAHPDRRQRFVKQSLEFIKNHNFDGELKASRLFKELCVH